jgi:hypothetical protein
LQQAQQFARGRVTSLCVLSCPALHPSGIGYSIIPPGLAGGSAAFNLLKPGAGCVYQGPAPGHEQQAWGSYSGADIHVPSLTAWTAVSYAQHKSAYTSIPSNAGTWLQAFVPAHVSQSYNPSYSTPAPNVGLPRPLPGQQQQQQQQRAGDARGHDEVSYVHGGPEQYEHMDKGGSGDFYDDSADQVQVLPHPIGLHGHSGYSRGYESWAHEGLEQDEEGGAWDEEGDAHGSTTRAAASGSSTSIQRWAPEDADGTVAGKPTATAQPQAASSPSPASKPADDMLAKVRMWLSQATQHQQQQQQAPTSSSSSSTVSTQPTRVQQPGQGAALLQALVNPLQQQQPGSSKQPAVHAHKQHGRQAGHSASTLMPGPQVGASADAAAAAAAAAASSNQVASPGVQLPIVPLLAQLSGAFRSPAPHPDGGQQGQQQAQQQAQIYFDDYEAHS